MILFISLTSCDPVPKATRELNNERLLIFKNVLIDVRQCLPKETLTTTIKVSLNRSARGESFGAVRVGKIKVVEVLYPSDYAVESCIRSRLIDLEIRMRSLVDIDTFEVTINYNRNVLIFNDLGGEKFEFSFE